MNSVFSRYVINNSFKLFYHIVPDKLTGALRKQNNGVNVPSFFYKLGDTVTVYVIEVSSSFACAVKIYQQGLVFKVIAKSDAVIHPFAVF